MKTDAEIREHFKSGSKVCIECGVRPVRGCRCVMGATHCDKCYDHGPNLTHEEVLKKYADKIYERIEADIFDQWNKKS